MTIPLRYEARHEQVVKRCDSCKPLGMFRIAEDFLLCYDGMLFSFVETVANDLQFFLEFGIYVNEHGGESTRAMGMIEWEGTAEGVALHPPYFLLFNSTFIEVRHLATGQLCQIIQGSGIRCIWNDRRCITDMDTDDPDNVQGGLSRGARVHTVMKSTDIAATLRPSVQETSSEELVFELLPVL